MFVSSEKSSKPNSAAPKKTAVTSCMLFCLVAGILAGNIACESKSSKAPREKDAKEAVAADKKSDTPTIVRKTPPPSSSNATSGSAFLLKPGQPLAKLSVVHRAPKKRGVEGRLTQLSIDVKDGVLFSISAQGKPLKIGKIDVDKKKREVRLFVGDKQKFRVRFQSTGYLVYDENDQYRFSGRRTNLGWDLKRSSHEGTQVTELGRHVKGTLTTSAGAFSAIVQGDSIVVGGPGLGRLVVRGLSQEAATLFGVRDLSLEERLALAIFVHSLGREHRPSSKK
ncbi:MAG: hypothetical protein GY822_29045 [Deltaproteobacteria bacterium]|nr:hypothetical protein [Deltaproteobacteria bacterium]